MFRGRWALWISSAYAAFFNFLDAGAGDFSALLVAGTIRVGRGAGRSKKKISICVSGRASYGADT